MLFASATYRLFSHTTDSANPLLNSSKWLNGCYAVCIKLIQRYSSSYHLFKPLYFPSYVERRGI
jgi:hypothetical protein